MLFSSHSVMSNFATPWATATAAFPVLHHLLEFAQTHAHWVSGAIQPSQPLSSPILLPLIFPSIRVFSNESVLCIRWLKSWNFRFSISTSNKYLGFIFFRIDWFDPLALQGTLKSLLQHHSSKASILWCSTFFMVQLSHTWLLDKSQVWLYGPLSAKQRLCFLIC